MKDIKKLLILLTANETIANDANHQFIFMDLASGMYERRIFSITRRSKYQQFLVNASFVAEL